MKCYFCEIEMEKVKISGDIYGTGIYIFTKEKGVLGGEKRSLVNAFVCPKCGRIELIAENPSISN